MAAAKQPVAFRFRGGRSTASFQMLLDGVDITHHVREFSVSAAVGSLPEVKLTLVGMDIGGLPDGDAAQPRRAVSLRGRA